MLLPALPLRRHNRKLLAALIAATFTYGACAGTTDTTNDEGQEIVVATDGNVETKVPTLRPAQPLRGKPTTDAAVRSNSKQRLSFRKPAIDKPEPVIKPTGKRGKISVPAKTVSNRVVAKPQTAAQQQATAEPAARPVVAEWVARDAVNLNQPLRDPGNQYTAPSPNQPAPQSVITTPMNAARMNTVSPAPSYVGDPRVGNRFVGDVEPQQAEPPAREKVRPTLVLPKDRQPNIPSLVQKPVEEKTAADVTPRSMQTPKANALLEPELVGPQAPQRKPQAEESRADRVVDRLLPTEGTAVGSVVVPPKKVASDKISEPANLIEPRSVEPRSVEPRSVEPEDSALQLQPPATRDTAKATASPKERVASSKKDDIVVRKLRIDADGSDVDAEPGRTVYNSHVIKREADGTARSYLGDLEPDEPETNQTNRAPQPDAEQTLDYVGVPTSSRQVSHSIRRLQPGMKRVLNHFYHRPEKADGRSNWGMLHSIMVFGTDTRVEVGPRTYSAIAWIAGNNICRGQRLVENSESGIQVRSGVGLQGHQAQMLAVFAICGVPLEYPIYADGQQYTIDDVLQAEMKACKSGEELTFTLIAMSHYLDSDATWVADDGETWSVERLIREELSQPIVGAACGGTHRLMGFTHALRNRRMQGQPITGQWARAEAFTQDFVRYAYQLQNRDGSMSTNWFEGREDNGDVDRKIQTTGHIVEWLLTVTPDSQLENPRLVAAIRFLLSSLYGDLEHDWKIGPKGHALRSLAMYHQRVFGTQAWPSAAMAKSGTESRRR